MKIIFRKLFWLIGLACLALTAQAGVVIHQEGGEIGGSKPKNKMTVYLDAGRIRVEGDNPDGKKFAMIFDQDKQVVWMIDSGNGTYIEMTAAQIQAMADQMGNMMKQMEAQLANMPPEQRARMEGMMKQRMGGGGVAPTISVQEKGSGEKVGPYSTIHYDVLTNGQRTSEIWAASKGDMHLQEADFKTFQGMAKFYEPLTRNAPKGSWSTSAMQQIQGFPVRTVIYDGQRPSFEWTVTGVEQRSLEGGLFTLPPGLKKNEMMGPMGPGGRMGGPPRQ